jgi:membrane protease subunit HflK
MLTKDENMINAKFAVQYKINDAQKYLFNVANPKLTLRQVSPAPQALPIIATDF